jgi:hypothetical protein
MTTSTGLKTAAIWARVSTKGQDEISPSSQISRCKDLLEKKGYTLIKTFSVVYCSLELAYCAEFQELRNMVDTKQIQAIAIYNRDRLEAIPVQRINFLAQLKKAGVEVLIVDGPPLLQGNEGTLVEFVLTMGKDAQVYNARTGSRRGLHDRVCGTKNGDKVLPQRPANHQKVFGYDWNTETETLTPNSDCSTVKMIFDLALSGKGYLKISHELQKKGILSPRGSTWAKANVSNSIHNPIYAGRYMGLRTSRIRGEEPGYKLQHIPESEWHWIKEVTIIDPVISWEQREVLLQQIQKHIRLSSRNAKREYLLRGMIESDENIGRQGKPVKYHGRSLPGHGYGYVVQVDGKQSHYITGKKLEDAVKKSLTDIFESEGPSFWQKMNNLQKINIPELETELKKQQAKLAKAYQNEATFEIRALDMQKDVYELARAKLHVTRMSIEEGLKDIQDQIDSASHIEETIVYFDDIRTKFLKNAKNFTDIQWRELLETLDCQIRIFKQGSSDLVEDFTLVPFENDDDREPVYEFLKDNYADSDSPELRAAEKFILNSKTDVVTLLHEFDAVMLLKGPYRVPQKVASIGLSEPWKASHLFLGYNL